MRHAFEVYLAHEFSELGENRDLWGLDKNWGIAPEVVQCGRRPVPSSFLHLEPPACGLDKVLLGLPGLRG